MGKKSQEPHQFKLHDAHTIPQDVGGCSEKFCESIQGIVLEWRASNLESGQKMYEGMIKAVKM